MTEFAIDDFAEPALTSAGAAGESAIRDARPGHEQTPTASDAPRRLTSTEEQTRCPIPTCRETLELSSGESPFVRMERHIREAHPDLSFDPPPEEVPAVQLDLGYAGTEEREMEALFGATVDPQSGATVITLPEPS